jgi:ABC-type branched-subunit amino acid transport system ATPase component
VDVLRIDGLVAGYSHATVLNDVSLVVGDELVCVLGPNGCGKSTLLKTIVGLVPARAGSISFKGRDISGMEPHELLRHGLSYVPQVANVFPSLTVRENIDLMFPRGTSRTRIADGQEFVLDLFPALRSRLSLPARTMSGGERQMLALARALVIRPDLLLLDEPSAALAPKVVTEVFERIREVRQRGVPVLLVEQNARKALAMADRGYVMDGGKEVLTGTGADLLADPSVGHLYLGGIAQPSGIDR